MALVSIVQNEVCEAIEEAFDAICKADYIAFILFIGRAEIQPKSGYERFTFEDFQEKFLYSVILMNKMENYQELNHNLAAEKDTALTEPFLTPDGVRV